MPASQHEQYERGFWGFVTHWALDVGRSLNAGWSPVGVPGRLCLSPRDQAFLKPLPAPLRAAVLACERPDSRYLPPTLRTALKVGPARMDATDAERLAHLRIMLPKAAAAVDAGDNQAEYAARSFVIRRPKNFHGAARIRQEIAALADVPVSVLEKWEANVRRNLGVKWDVGVRSNHARTG
jgi:hypothetical protein